MELIRGISGIRGIVEKTFNNSIISKYVQAFSILQHQGDILIARDSREHGKDFLELACKTLQECGRNIYHLDIIPTPTAQFLVKRNNLAGGIVITASHNPEEWNGLKFIDSNGCFLDAKKNIDLFNITDGQIKQEKMSGEIYKIESGYLSHVDHILNLSIIEVPLIQKKKYNVVVDAVNGAASKALPCMLKSLGCEVHLLHCEPNGKFPRGTEPLPQNLKKLSNKIIELRADVGFATDPDGDRLAVIDEKGNALGEEYTLTICADGFFRSTNSRHPVVTNLSTTIALDRIANKYGSSVIRSAVGEINVVDKMKKTGALLGGEGNGGVILKENHLGRDSLIGVALFLNRMAQTTSPVSHIFQSMPQYHILKDKISINTKNTDQILKKIETKFGSTSINKTDGLKLSWDNSWIHVRKSNTEPIIRIYAEASSKIDALKLIDKVKSII
tara:strand:- start:3195 stop:4529 length:1335 start_codon:yes stop_codon:yes gene_type:complete